MIGDMCLSECEWMCFAWEEIVCFVLRFLHELFLTYWSIVEAICFICNFNVSTRFRAKYQFWDKNGRFMPWREILILSVWTLVQYVKEYLLVIGFSCKGYFNQSKHWWILVAIWHICNLVHHFALGRSISFVIKQWRFMLWRAFLISSI